MVHQHHERLDGSGYPQGLRGDEILPGSQLLSIADSFEAMVSHRPYRPGLGAKFAMNELKNEEGLHYSKPGIDVLFHLLDSKNDRLSQIIPVIQSR